jgi:hypothetical protein
MKNFIVQLTLEGGPTGTKIVPADYYVIENSGAITFYINSVAIVSFSSFAVAVDIDSYNSIEAATSALLGSQDTTS